MRGIAAGEDRYDWSPPRVSTPSPLDWKRSDEAYASPEKRERRDQSAPQSCLTGKAYAFQKVVSRSNAESEYKGLANVAVEIT
ncbi:hypothetical protein CK203_114220 [Vitis vinifera]|uniref:Uncharacterized protein n=1 Tax=Vitis vinifera TaxID=29760 RepID=A0A438D654_VITVI|nr:hypothetical protein CK203_114220 [Vitis vinifera]